ncbi:hypothetical protein DCCM_0779 [Desulfocucumis palustris]|uniref:Uncharacterized protein n=1 Tax=Desulfocucumis palustris TaxID=1898651 RepID=A0A2L2XAB9_9FIRM|nr:hypothetical protein DCCM_0779 [Desulfocucumis palustris]
MPLFFYDGGHTLFKLLKSLRLNKFQLVMSLTCDKMVKLHLYPCHICS